jgi:hypothetical protein
VLLAEQAIGAQYGEVRQCWGACSRCRCCRHEARIQHSIEVLRAAVVMGVDRGWGSCHGLHWGGGRR